MSRTDFLVWIGIGLAGVLAMAAALVWATSTSDAGPSLQSERHIEETILADALAEVDQPLLQMTFTGDLDEIIQRRVLRILVTYNKTNFFIADGQPRGFEYDLLQQYKDYLKTRVKPRSWPTVFMFIPVPFDQLLPALEEGRGDIAAAGLTITPQRLEKVDFTEPYITGVREIVVTASGVTGLDSLEDLSGRQVYVDLGTSYAQSLAQLNESLTAKGLEPVEILPADSSLTTEDILELVNAGVVDITIADNHIAEIWAKTLPGIVVHKDLAVREGGEIAWAVRKNNPDLKASLNKVISKIEKGTLIGNIVFKDYYKNTSWIESPMDGIGAERLAKLEDAFRKYADQYGFDWLEIAALAYQESRLDPTAKSGRGAVGVMQILPDTARGEPILIEDISRVDNNIHAGVKYLAHLRDDYFDDPNLENSAKVDFALAAYNAGPTRISKLRDRADREGLDPNHWFSNVEQVARRSIGRETVNYVANINKYFVAYKLSNQQLEQRREAKESVSDSLE
ncbi:MAG: transporter substrate-binding domain-containing protein [Pseudomonadota bacterium]